VTDVSARKTERLLNLVICLLATRRFLSAEQVRTAVPGYAESEEAFKRAFERDKEELRELGIPLETGSNDVLFDDEVGYRIARDSYALPDISLAADEAAVLGLAARAWQQASIAGAASSALLKLEAAGVRTGEVTPAGIEPRVETREPAFLPLWEAVREARPVTFPYRTPGSPTSTERRLEPWGVVCWHGRWYVAGHDVDRRDTRVFRLDRVAGPVRATGPAGSVSVPDGVDLRGTVASFAARQPTGTARLRVRAGTAYGLRRYAAAVRPAGKGWDEADLDFADVEALADEILGYGADVVVIDPPEARAAVIRRLRAIAGKVAAGASGTGDE
jgi:proteasome accessory factor B